jgi:hypothetical protein
MKEERLARRVVETQRALAACRQSAASEESQRITVEDLDALDHPHDVTLQKRVDERRRVRVQQAVTTTCGREDAEAQAARIAVELAMRRR